MKIRSRLLLIYGVMFILLLLAGFFSLTSILELKKSADDLSEIYLQSIRAEQLRANTQRQINYSFDFILGEEGAEEVFANIQENTELLIEELTINSKTSTEADLIENLEETQYELVWLTNRYFKAGQNNLSVLNLPEARARLREIGDEVADDVATLTKYYNQQQSRKLDAAAGAGKTVAWVVGATAALALLQFIALVILSQRWLVKPISDLNLAAASISQGNLDTYIEFPGKNEWGQLSNSINKMTASLKESLQKLAAHERSAAMVELAAYASHNIRNPLSGIRAAAQVIVNDKRSLDSETEESLREIIATIDRLDNWLKRLLEYARPLRAEFESVDLNRLIKESVNVAEKTYPEKKIRLDWKLAKNLPRLFIDPILIEQALMIILSNAYESIDRKGVVTVKTSVLAGEDNIRIAEIRISDTGKGISRDIQSNLFRAFMTSKDGGTGLGLAQAKKIVDIHGGRINLESSPGEGTLVTIMIPLKDKAS